MHLQYKLMNIFIIKCYFRANLKIDVTKNRIFWGISLIKLRSDIDSSGNLVLLLLVNATRTCKMNM